MLLRFLLSFTALIWVSESSRYGCLFKPRACLEGYFCYNDGFSGHCIATQTKWKHDSSINFHGKPKASKSSEFSSYLQDTKDPLSDKLFEILNDAEVFLAQNGITLSSLSDKQIDLLAASLARLFEREQIKAQKKSETKALIQLIFDARDELLSHGVRLDQLNKEQLNVLSTAILHLYSQGKGFPKLDVKPKSENGATHEKRKSEIDGKFHNKDDIISTLPQPENVKEENPKPKTDHNHVLSGQKKEPQDADSTALNSSPSVDEKLVPEQESSDVENIEEEDTRKPEKLKLKGDVVERLSAEAKREGKEGQINAAVSQGMTYTNTVPLTQEDVYIIIIVVSIVAIILIVVISTVCYCMKSIERRKKLIGSSVQSEDDDYQELCRQHYASKAAEQKDYVSRPLRQDQRSDSASSTPTLVFSPAAHQRNNTVNSHKASRNSSLSSWSEEPVTATLDISTGHAVLSYMEDHIKNKNRLTVEWLALCKYQAETVSTTVAHDNMIRNRTPHILPYDHNRVKLGVANSEESDYINASFIIDNDPRFPMYIATQGPLPSTIHHFWQMVWEQGSVAIVMLTPITEDGVAQCARYWPDEGSSIYNGFEIHLVSEHIWCEDYLVRSLYLKNLKTCETRTITQFHFLSWPRNGVPFSPRPLLELRRKVSKCFRGSNAPMVVHCSDGVGRTGTYILIDLVISRMLKGVKEMDIAATLEHLRDQRAGMVASKDQLEFALGSVADEVNAILKVLLH